MSAGKSKTAPVDECIAYKGIVPPNGEVAADARELRRVV